MEFLASYVKYSFFQVTNYLNFENAKNFQNAKSLRRQLTRNTF